MCGCNHGLVTPPGAAKSASRIREAMAFVKDQYHVSVRRLDDKTIGVSWSNGAEAEFKQLRERVSKEYAVEVLITEMD